MLELLVQKSQILDCQWERHDPPRILSAAHTSASYHMDLHIFKFTSSWNNIDQMMGV